MEWLNYHHLLYFWTVARAGSVTRACQELHLAQPTVSGQLRRLERSLGVRLFERRGRGLALTDAGRVAFGYADEIFRLGRELPDALRSGAAGPPLRLDVGIADVLTKLVAFRLLEPALRLGSGAIHVVCHEDRADALLARLAVNELDVVIADAPQPPGLRVRAYNHLLGECGITFFAAPSLAARVRRGFPASLDGAPFLAPIEGTVARRALDDWFAARQVRPAIVGEFEDSALMKVFGQAGRGVFAVPSVVERHVARQYGVRVVGATADVRERFYAISGERRIKHPAVVAIAQGAGGLFG